MPVTRKREYPKLLDRSKWKVVAELPRYGFELALRWEWEQPLRVPERERTGWDALMNQGWAFWHPGLRLLLRLDGYYGVLNSAHLYGWLQTGLCPERVGHRIERHLRARGEAADTADLMAFWSDYGYEFGLYHTDTLGWSEVQQDCRNGLGCLEPYRLIANPLPIWPRWPTGLGLYSYGEHRALYDRLTSRGRSSRELSEHQALALNRLNRERWSLLPEPVRAVVPEPGRLRCEARHAYCDVETPECVARQHEQEAEAVLKVLGELPEIGGR